MRNQVLYGSIFVIVSLLLTTLIFTAEAKTFDKELTLAVKGDGVLVQSKQIRLTVAPLDNIKDTLAVSYIAKINDGEFAFGLICTGPDSILKSSALRKASVEFNTEDLVCIDGTQTDHQGVISINIETIDESNFLKYDDASCSLIDGINFCSRIRGTSDGNDGEANGTVFGEVLNEGASGRISKINEKRTYWTEP